MTEKQAIEVLHELDGTIYETQQVALDMAIKALEQQSSDDCVSRADLLKIYENRFIELQKAHQADKQLGVNWCINTLKDMPPVTPTHGSCKDCKQGQKDDHGVYCTNLGGTNKESWYCADFEKRGNENE